MFISFDTLAASHATRPGVVRGQMFGKLCVKVNGNAYLASQNEGMAFKLTGDEHGRALAVPDAHLWDPSGKGRPMKEWVHGPVRMD